MARLYPVMLQVEGRRCVVVGGGNVAERKVSGLLAAGAQVSVISPELTEELSRLAVAGAITYSNRPYQEGDLADAMLVFAATDKPEVNRQVIMEAQRLDILHSAADRPESSSFVTPAIVRRGELVLTVSASGASPMLAARIRGELEQQYGPEYECLTAWLGELRRRIHALDKPPQTRREMLGRALELPETAWQPEQSEDRWRELLISLSQP
ncbi:precorrin-2 dehydrogenase/sirohydrochlorin ferrochelatase family protein [Paenibacillus daejeonensis]|uniref:precorrin-2 dehydrogenase/sirohydrochlorin ferrochelatase family protein n=1 Tax=Paenibacillus daejeonensis TaxID=135193 RepID=UPI0003756B26|nr:bifunctional precorrin-2 dehydrogenase/sirohydrochlorin ferrochelatase [Paenibacillus daejeonensis]